MCWPIIRLPVRYTHSSFRLTFDCYCVRGGAKMQQTIDLCPLVCTLTDLCARRNATRGEQLCVCVVVAAHKYMFSGRGPFVNGTLVANHQFGSSCVISMANVVLRRYRGDCHSLIHSFIQSVSDVVVRSGDMQLRFYGPTKAYYILIVWLVRVVFC